MNDTTTTTTPTNATRTTDTIPLKDQLSDLAGLLKALEKYKGVAVVNIDVIYGNTDNSFSLSNYDGEFDLS